MPQFPFVDGSYQSRSLNFDAQRCINLYPELSESGTSASQGMLIGTPGTRLITNVGDGPIRGMLRVDEDALLVASGFELYRLDKNFNSTLVGEIYGTGRVVMASNGNDVMIVVGSGQPGYFVNKSTWSITVADPTIFTGADRVDFLDGRLVWNVTGTGQFMWTGIYDTTLDALNYATAECSPDNITTMLIDHREVWLFGKTTTEVWYPSGDADLPMQRIEGAFIEYGCAATHSVAKLDNTVFWLGADDRGSGMIWRASGYNPQRVSTHAVEYAISHYSRIDDAYAFTYQQEGHSFYVIIFPSAEATWVYDASSQRWHERMFRGDDGVMQRIRANAHAFFSDLNIVGDFEDNRLYSLELDYYKDDGITIPRIRTAAHITSDGNMVTISELRIDFETGVGLVLGQGDDPQAMLEVSKDGGHTFGSELWVDIGKIGERRARAIWRRLGQSRDWVFRVTVSDPIPVRIIGASIEVK